MLARTAVALVLGSFLAVTGWAQDKALTAQQQRMKSCNAQASKMDIKGEERKAFMSDCLKSGTDDKLTAQQQRMKTCNEQAGRKSLKGDERKAFMSSCLRKDAPHAATGGSARSKTR
jgi:hypothetical protein